MPAPLKKIVAYLPPAPAGSVGGDVVTSCAHGENYSHELHMSRGYTEGADTEQW